MVAAVEPARPPPMIAMSVYLMGNSGLEAPVLRPKGKQKLSREKLEPVSSVSGYIYPGIIVGWRDSRRGRGIAISDLPNSREALNPQMP
jgi:hypothetical protein